VCAKSCDPESYAGGSLLLVVSPIPDRSKVKTESKRYALALQVGGQQQVGTPSETVFPQGVAPLPLRTTGPPGPGGSTC
jgi:hypothetical protein